MRDNPIGIFDSGLGGLSVLREIRKILPYESVVYYADSGNCPYGTKETNEALNLSQKGVSFLSEKGCKLIIIACNTVTGLAIDSFRNSYNIPFIGMEPALKPAAVQTRTGKVGVLATQNTFKGRHFNQTREKYANGVELIIQAGNGLVELVESGEQESAKARELLEQYLQPMIEKGIDTLVLGCTHYPFFKPLIQEITDNRITILDPANAVAAHTRRILKENDLLEEKQSPSRFDFYTTGKKDVARYLLSQTLACPFSLELI